MRTIIVLLAIAVCFPANAILIDAADDAASLALAESYPFMCCAALWDEAGGTRYRGGSGTLVCNNEQDGAWVLTAKHAIDDAQGVYATNFIRYTFESCYFNAFPKGTTGYVADMSVAVVNGKVFFHYSQDIALAKLEHLVRNATGDLITPVEFYHGELVRDQVILVGGFGETGAPSNGGPQCTGVWDGKKRCARSIFKFISTATPGKGLMEFERTVSVPGMVSCGDSGGFAAVEEDDKVLTTGVIITGSGSGETALTGFAYLSYDPEFFSWVSNIIDENGETPTAVTNWNMY